MKRKEEWKQEEAINNDLNEQIMFDKQKEPHIYKERKHNI